jgi:ferric-dicitrate binding protein FerR (iron transport regulator)
MSRADTDASLSRTLDILGVEKKQPVRLVWMRYAVAAALLLAIATGGYFWLKARSGNTPPIAKNTAPAQDVPAGGDKAILTLADGSQIVLDSAANGDLAQQGSIKVQKLNGQLKYSVGHSDDVYAAGTAYNTVRTPRGGQYELVLQDGTKVWLNAASTLKYPTAFNGRERIVELTGEGYFEVKPLTPKGGQGKIPFKVLVPGGQEVEVLGTHFNIMAYKDEPLMRTTLLEGSVRVHAMTGDQKPTLLAPGQQAQISSSGAVLVDQNADVDQAVAWKNGFQIFHNADLPTILRQVSRWYDVDVEYQTKAFPEMGLDGTIPRSVSLQNMIKVLELNNDQVHLKLENNKIIVLP